MNKLILCVLFLLSSGLAFAQPAHLDVRRYGAKCDGSTNDSTAFNLAIAAAIAAPANGPKSVFVPSGTCRAAIAITEAKGIRLFGAGRDRTIIATAASGSPAVQGNGIWYSQFEGITFRADHALTNKAVFELDGNYDGSHTQGVQGNTFKDCFFDANSLATYGLAIVRQGTSVGQGSENIFINCHYQAALTAGCLVNGANALQNTFLGGNFQACGIGIYVVSGSINVISAGFQNGQTRAQIENQGYDLAFVNSANDHSTIRDCRSESLQFLSVNNAHAVELSNNNIVNATNQWAATTAYAQGDFIKGVTGAGGDGKLYIALVGGTSGGTEPVWPATNDIYAATGAITASSTTFTCASCGLLTAPMVGKGIIVDGAGSAGTVPLYTTIAAFVNSGQVTLTAAASTTVSGKQYRVGSIVTDGSVTWMEYDYYEIGLSNIGTLMGNILSTGRVSIGSAATNSVQIIGNTFQRPDWLSGLGTNFDNARVTMLGNVYRPNGGQNNGGTAAAYAVAVRNGNTVPGTFLSPFAIGGQSLVWNGGTGGTNYPEIYLSPDLVNSRLTFNGGTLVMGTTPQTLTGAGAVNLTTPSTLLVTTGANALTLAAGSEGQTKFIRMKTDAGDGTLSVTNGQGFTTITFNDAGDFVLLFYQDSRWHLLTNSGCVVA